MINDQFANLNHGTGAGAYLLDANGHRRRSAVNYAPDRMWGAALTLIIIVMALNIIARFIGRFNKVRSKEAGHHGQAHRRQGPQRLLRQVPRRQRRAT